MKNAVQQSVDAEAVLYPIERRLDYRVTQRFLVAASDFDEAADKVGDFLHSGMSHADSRKYGVVQVSDTMEQIDNSHETTFGDETMPVAGVTIEQSLLDRMIEGKAPQILSVLEKIVEAPLVHRREALELISAIRDEAQSHRDALVTVIAQAHSEHVAGVGSDQQPQAIAEFEMNLDAIRATHVTEIERLVIAIKAGNAERFHDSLWLDIVDDLKGRLGAESANDSADTEEAQEAALVEAETWVEDNVSNSSNETIIATAIWLYGLPWTERKIRESVGQ